MKQHNFSKIYSWLTFSILLTLTVPLHSQTTSFSEQQVQRIAYVVDSLTLQTRLSQTRITLQDSLIEKYKLRGETFQRVAEQQDSVMILRNRQINLLEDQLAFCIEDVRKTNATKFKTGVMTGAIAALVIFLIVN